MSKTIELPSDLERELAAEAERAGLSLDEYALRVLEARSSGDMSPRTGAELVEFWKAEGVIGARPELVDAPAHARRLRDEAEHRHRA
jgi:hypothetical protein